MSGQGFLAENPVAARGRRRLDQFGSSTLSTATIVPLDAL